MNTFNNQPDHFDGYEKSGSQARRGKTTRREKNTWRGKDTRPEKEIPQDGNLPAVLPPQEDDSLPVLLRPAGRRAEAFLPEWLRRLARG